MESLKKWERPIIIELNTAFTMNVCDNPNKLPPGDDGTSDTSGPCGVVPTS